MPRRYRYLEKARPGVDLAHVDPDLLTLVNEIGRQLRKVVTVTSGYRSPALNKRVGGASESRHLYGRAVDAEIDGRPVLWYPGVAAIVRAFGLRSGDQAGFMPGSSFGGGRDPVHIDMGAAHDASSWLDFTELVAAWLRAGGPPAQAATAARIGLAESHGNPKAHCLNCAGVREDSRGLMQVNVAPNANPQFRRWNLYDPDTNMRAAVRIFKSAGFGAWSTFTSGAYRNYGPDAQPSQPPSRYPPPAGTQLPPRPGAGGGGDDGTDGLASDVPIFYNPLDAPGDVLHGLEHVGEGAAGKVWHLVTGASSATWGVAKAIASIAQMFVVLVGFIVNPRSWVRLAEFLVGIGLLFKTVQLLVDDSGGDNSDGNSSKKPEKGGTAKSAVTTGAALALTRGAGGGAAKGGGGAKGGAAAKGGGAARAAAVK